MKIAVLGGAGAMGAVFGARLQQAGHQVTLIDPNAEAIARIAREGVTIELKTGEKSTTRLGAVTEAAAAGPADLLVNFVKCYHTEGAIRAALPILAPGASILSLQNGWGNAPVIAKIGELYRPNVGAIGIANPQEILHMVTAPGKMLTSEMSPREGVMAAQWLGLDVVLPCHYIYPDGDADVAAFQQELEAARGRGGKPPRSLVMRAGEILEWPPEV